MSVHLSFPTHFLGLFQPASHSTWKARTVLKKTKVQYQKLSKTRRNPPASKSVGEEERGFVVVTNQDNDNKTVLKEKEENLGCSWNSSVKGFFGRIFGSLPLVLSSSFLCLLVKVSWSQRQTGKEEDRFVLCVLLFFTDSYTRKRKKFLRETNIPFALSWLRHFFFLSYILTLTEEERKGCFCCVNNIKRKPTRSLLQDNGQ